MRHRPIYWADEAVENKRKRKQDITLELYSISWAQGTSRTLAEVPVHDIFMEM